MEITSRDRKQLKALAHHLDPVVRIGRQGLTEGVIAETRRALEAHELIKIRLEMESSRDRRETARRLSVEVDSALVGTVGKIAILYRAHPEEPKIRLNRP